MNKENLLFLQELIDIVKVSKELQNIKKEMIEGSNHYEFLYLITRVMKPELDVELGTERGLSMLYMMEGHPSAKFYTVDINPESGLYLKDKNVTRIIGDSAKSANQIPDNIDILFEDTNHKYGTINNEFNAYFPKLREGGIMIFDDINSKGVPGAKEWWEDLNYPIKINFNKVHLGFGMSAIIKCQ